MTRNHSSISSGIRLGLAAVALVALGSLAATASAGGDLTLRRSTIDGGGGSMSGGPFVLRGTIGQHDATIGPVSHPIGFDVVGGFWTPLVIDAACRPDLSSDGVLDFFDILIFVGWLADDDPRADWNDDGVLDFFDVIAYVGEFDAGCP